MFATQTRLVTRLNHIGIASSCLLSLSASQLFKPACWPPNDFANWLKHLHDISLRDGDDDIPPDFPTQALFFSRYAFERQQAILGHFEQFQLSPFWIASNTQGKGKCNTPAWVPDPSLFNHSPQTLTWATWPNQNQRAKLRTHEKANLPNQEIQGEPFGALT